MLNDLTQGVWIFVKSFIKSFIKWTVIIWVIIFAIGVSLAEASETDAPVKIITH
jgi:hypothetical protein